MYELKKPEIDAMIDKARAQWTSVYDKHLHKVGRRGARVNSTSMSWRPAGLSQHTPTRAARPAPCPRAFAPQPTSHGLTAAPAPLQIVSKIPRHPPAKPAESSSDRKEE